MSPKPSFAPLVRCRECGSKLLQPLAVVGPVEGLSIVARFCPECGRRDIVVGEHLAVEVWLRREERVAAWMEESADALALALARAERAPRQWSAGAGSD